jgi:chorismate mutase/prephenate dehydratase
LATRGIDIIPVASTGAAAEQASKDSASAAICSKVCLVLYEGLQVVQAPVQDDRRNRTRFCVLSDASDAPTKNDKTLICVYVRRFRVSFTSTIPH